MSTLWEDQSHTFLTDLIEVGGHEDVLEGGLELDFDLLLQGLDTARLQQQRCTFITTFFSSKYFTEN